MAAGTAETLVDDAGAVAGVAAKLVGLFGGALPGSGWLVTALNIIASAPAMYTDLATAGPIITNVANAALAMVDAAKSDAPVDPAKLQAQQQYIDDMQSAVAQGLPHDVAVRFYPSLANHGALFG